MKKELFFGLVVCTLIFIVSCTQQQKFVCPDGSKVIDTSFCPKVDSKKETIIKETIIQSGEVQTKTDGNIVCNKPYIRVGTSCCLDQNENKICDKDESPQASGAIPYECTFQSGLACLDFKITATSLDLIIQNSLGYDIIIESVEAQQCSTQNTRISLRNGERITSYLECRITSAIYDADVNIIYTNPETGLQHKNQGHINDKVEATA